LNIFTSAQNPVTDHLPVNTIKLSALSAFLTAIHCILLSFACALALSGDAPTIRLSKYLPTLPQTHSVAVFVGAMARGRDDFADAIVDEKISISDYSLSASVACGKVRWPRVLRRLHMLILSMTVLLRS
jgi:rRNA small subunit pseudouridine methyltransferase Nep1